MIFLGKLIPVVADEVKLVDEALVAVHLAGPLSVRDTVADLEISIEDLQSIRLKLRTSPDTS